MFIGNNSSSSAIQRRSALRG